jgi:hypothetical protein
MNNGKSDISMSGYYHSKHFMGKNMGKKIYPTGFNP